MLAVAGERHEVLDQRRHVIKAMRPLRMPRHLRLLPRGEPGIDLLERLRRLAFDAADLVGDRVAVALSARNSSILASSSATGFSKSR